MQLKIGDVVKLRNGEKALILYCPPIVYPGCKIEGFSYIRERIQWGENGHYLPFPEGRHENDIVEVLGNVNIKHYFPELTDIPIQDKSKGFEERVKEHLHVYQTETTTMNRFSALNELLSYLENYFATDLEVKHDEFTSGDH